MAAEGFSTANMAVEMYPVNLFGVGTPLPRSNHLRKHRNTWKLLEVS